MSDRQHQEPFADSLPGIDSPLRPLTVAVNAESQNDLPSQEREEEWQRLVLSLQEWIAELLIRNQQLRMSLLASATNPQAIEDRERLYEGGASI
jgi:hypothetical protein